VIFVARKEKGCRLQAKNVHFLDISPILALAGHFLAFDHIYWRSQQLALTNFISVHDFLSALNLFYQRSAPVYQRSELFIGVRTLFISAREVLSALNQKKPLFSVRE
ncbi:hypothetical protein, partial [Alkalibacillus haloalkaliphilus]|uniref:hypothetical protein n=1 Tax=Alkalibacillus haloalkaliphilus TaxID=94136 RepID=UPI0029359A4D